MKDRNALLLSQLRTLLLRLELGRSRDARLVLEAGSASRVARLRKLVEGQYRSRRSVTWYASQLGCSERTLNRATRAVAGRPVKALISERTALEAKRLLVHSGLAVEAIAADLGFGEASNFAKFFKREAGCTPTTFRARYAEL